MPSSAPPSSPPPPNSLITPSLLPLLLEISTHPLPPPKFPPQEPPLRRASVAVIIRIHPSPSPSSSSPPLPTDAAPPPRTLQQFFAQPWVRDARSSPEILLIKRAARPGDRWTAHVALPGGKRDPGDASDEAAAVREVREEVGLDMIFPPEGEGEGEGGGEEDTTRNCNWNTLRVGALPPRLVTTAWGRTPLMVLCPFVFLHLPPAPPRLRLQRAEVASAHWVPVRHLLAPRATAGRARCAVAERLSRRDVAWGRGLRWVVEHTLGRMEFCGTELGGGPGGGWGYYTSASASEEGEEGEEGGWDAGQPEAEWEDGEDGEDGEQGKGKGEDAGDGKQCRRGMIMWGLTHAVLFDLLDALPPPGSLVRQWRYPTFTAPDVRLAVWLFGWPVRRNGIARVRRRMGIPCTPGGSRVGSGVSTPVPVEGGGVGGVRPLLGTESAVHILMDGYYASMRRAVWAGLIVRAVVAAAVLWWVGCWAWSGPGAAREEL